MPQAIVKIQKHEDRVSYTSFRPERVLIDIYNNGEIVLLVGIGDKEELYELGTICSHSETDITLVS